MRFVPVCGFFAATVLFASEAYPPPRFTDPERVQKLESALPQVDQIFRRYAADKKIPGMVWGCGHRWPAGARGISRRAGPHLERTRHGQHGVSHRLDDQEFYISRHSQAAR